MIPSVPPDDDARAEAERHIVEHSLGEAARIGRLSRIREFVLGAQDGLLVPLGVVTGMAAILAKRLTIAGTVLRARNTAEKAAAKRLSSHTSERTARSTSALARPRQGLATSPQRLLVGYSASTVPRRAARQRSPRIPPPCG